MIASILAVFLVFSGAVLPSTLDRATGNCGPRAMERILRNFGRLEDLEQLIDEIKPDATECSFLDLQKAFERRNWFAKAIQMNNSSFPKGKNWAAIVLVELPGGSSHFASLFPNCFTKAQQLPLRLDMGLGTSFVGHWHDIKDRYCSNYVLIVSPNLETEIERSRNYYGFATISAQVVLLLSLTSIVRNRRVL